MFPRRIPIFTFPYRKVVRSKALRISSVVILSLLSRLLAAPDCRRSCSFSAGSYLPTGIFLWQPHTEMCFARTTFNNVNNCYS